MSGGKVLHDLAAIDRNGHARPIIWTDIDTICREISAGMDQRRILEVHWTLNFISGAVGLYRSGEASLPDCAMICIGLESIPRKAHGAFAIRVYAKKGEKFDIIAIEYSCISRRYLLERMGQEDFNLISGMERI